MSETETSRHWTNYLFEKGAEITLRCGPVTLKGFATAAELTFEPPGHFPHMGMNGERHFIPIAEAPSFLLTMRIDGDLEIAENGKRVDASKLTERMRVIRVCKRSQE